MENKRRKEGEKKRRKNAGEVCVNTRKGSGGVYVFQQREEEMKGKGKGWQRNMIKGRGTFL